MLTVCKQHWQEISAVAANPPLSQSLKQHLVITKSTLLLALSLSTFTCLSYFPGVSWKACW